MSAGILWALHYQIAIASALASLPQPVVVLRIFFFTRAKGKWLLNGNLFYEACRRFLIRLFWLSLSDQTNHLKVTTRQNSKYHE